MRVIVKHRHKKGTEAQDSINVFIPKRSTEYVDVLRELWEREYNSWDVEPNRELSWLGENYARMENELYLVEFFITNVAEVEL